MAGTKRKRRTTKHRGNAAGMVEARGRTGRKPTADERKLSDKEAARVRREERLNRPPSWRNSANRAALAAAFFGLLIALFFNRSIPQSAALAGFMFLLYIPLGYYTDKVIYSRRNRKKAT